MSLLCAHMDVAMDVAVDVAMDVANSQQNDRTQLPDVLSLQTLLHFHFCLSIDVVNHARRHPHRKLRLFSYVDQHP